LRGRKRWLLILIAAAAVAAACSRRSSLYIEPGRKDGAGPDTVPGAPPARARAAKTAAPASKPSAAAPSHP